MPGEPIRIATFDLPQLTKPLQGEGIEVSEGSLGQVYESKKDGRFHQASRQGIEMPAHLRDFRIVAVDLARTEVVNHARAEYEGPNGGRDVYINHSGPFVDNRFLGASRAFSDMRAIFEAGGFFLFFAEHPLEMRAVTANSPVVANNGGGDTYVGAYAHRLSDISWGLAEVSSSVSSKDIMWQDGDRIARVLAPSYEKNSRINATFRFDQYNSRIGGIWKAFAIDSYGLSVGGSLWDGQGVLRAILMPQVSNKTLCTLNTLREVLAEFRPDLVGASGRASWLGEARYAVPAVASLESKKEALLAQAEKAAADIDLEIQSAYSVDGFLQQLITETGTPLRLAVLRALEELGVGPITDVDEVEGEDENGELREDLRFESPAGLVLVEVKGIGGIGTDEDYTSIQKQVMPRMREFKRFDIRGLVVLNHQRFIAPHLRSLEKVNDGSKLLPTLVGGDLTLLFTDTLRRMVLDARQFGWRPEDMFPILTKSGVCTGVPAHYEELGSIVRCFNNVPALGVALTSGKLVPGAQIAIEGPSGFSECRVLSLVADDEAIEEASAPIDVGIMVDKWPSDPRSGARVYAVRR